MDTDFFTIDAHSDYPLQVYRERLQGRKKIIEQNHLPYLRAGKVRLETVTVGGDFVLDGIDFRNPGTVYRVVDCIYEEMKESPGVFRLIREGADLEGIENNSRLSFIMGLEGAAPIGDDFSVFRNLYRLGLRSVSLTHNSRNMLADGCSEKANGGLSEAGKNFVKEVANYKMIIDLVHISEKSFFEVLELVDRPVVVSHSNAKKLCGMFRNLTDEQIRAVADTGGVVGVNFLCFMIDEDIHKAGLERLLDHIEYIADLCGIDHVGLGPDFADYYMEILVGWLEAHGYPVKLAKYVEEAPNVARISTVAQGLLKRGYSKSDIRKIMGKNFLRVYKQSLS